jgi:hypothetical protein
LLLNHSLDLFLQANIDSLDLCSGGGVVDEEEARYGGLSSACSWLGSAFSSVGGFGTVIAQPGMVV